jgi:hypothetical protein
LYYTTGDLPRRKIASEMLARKGIERHKDIQEKAGLALTQLSKSGNGQHVK